MSTLYVDNLQPNLGSQVEIPDLKPLAGSVVQVKQSQTSASLGTYVTTSFVDVGSGLQVVFTPLYATSKLLVTLHAQAYNTGSPNPYSAFTIFRDGVDQVSTSYGFGYMQVIDKDNASITSGNIYIDANSTTQTVFTMGVRSNGTTGYTANLNGNMQRSITVMEIAQ